MVTNASSPPYVLACAGVFLALCPIFTGLRLYARTNSKGGLGVDDWLMIPATMMAVGCAADLVVGVKLRAYAFPTPASTTADGNPNAHGSYIFTTVEQLEWGFFLMQILAMGLIKLSLVVFYRRIFGGGHNAVFRVVSAVVGVLTFCWAAAFFFWFLLSCPGNMAARWTSEQAKADACPTDNMSDLALAISDFLTDVMILALPVPMVLRLKMDAKRRLVILGVFGLGAVALVASIVRLILFVYLVNVANGVISDPTIDPNLNVTEGMYWSMLESGLSLIACNLPMMHGLLRTRGSRPNTNGNSNSSSRGARSGIRSPRPAKDAYSIDGESEGKGSASFEVVDEQMQRGKPVMMGSSPRIGIAVIPPPEDVVPPFGIRVDTEFHRHSETIV